MHSFNAILEIIGINPYVFVPEDILRSIFEAAGRDKGPIPVCGTVNALPYKQTLVRFQGSWRLYINTIMLKKSPERIGEQLEITIAFDPVSREEIPHEELIAALEAHPDAKAVFDTLPPSRRKEIVRYINRLKSDEIRTKNIAKAIAFLQGKERFVGRDRP